MIWEWEGDAGGWVPFSAEVNETLDAAKESGSKDAVILIFGQPYFIDLERLTQTNVRTGYKRRVRIHGVPRPDDSDDDSDEEEETEVHTGMAHTEPLVDDDEDEEEEEGLLGEVPKHFVCPLSCRIMKDPVSTVDGFSYERRFIAHWFKTKGSKKVVSSPMTGLSIESKVFPNRALKDAIEEFRADAAKKRALKKEPSLVDLSEPSQEEAPVPSMESEGDVKEDKSDETEAHGSVHRLMELAGSEGIELSSSEKGCRLACGVALLQSKFDVPAALSLIKASLEDQSVELDEKPASEEALPDGDDDNSTTVEPSSKLVEGVVVEHEGYRISTKNGVFFCNCKAWKFCGGSIALRSCKHLRSYLGEEHERERTGKEEQSSKAGTKRKLPASFGGPGASLGGGGGVVGGVNMAVANQVMLAHSWKTGADPSGWLMSEKLDGMRAWWDGTGLWSRTGKPIHAPDWWLERLPREVALDGELWLGRGQFQACMSIVRRHNANTEWKKITYMVFDAPETSGHYEERITAVKSVISSDIEHVRIHEFEVCEGTHHLEERLRAVEAVKGEGLMLRKPKSKYTKGRTNDLLKVKSSYDDEAIVTGHEDGKGKHEGRLGALNVRNKKNVAFKLGTGFSDSERENPPAIGSVVTYRYNELTKAGVPRFPVYVRVRPDVSPR